MLLKQLLEGGYRAGVSLAIDQMPADLVQQLELLLVAFSRVDKSGGPRALEGRQQVESALLVPSCGRQ